MPSQPEQSTTHDLQADPLKVKLALAPAEITMRQVHGLKADDATFDTQLLMARIAQEFAPKPEPEKES